MDAKRLKKYAHLIAQCGVNVQKKQDVFIQAALDQPDFVTMVVEECYKLGARKVFVDWSYQPISRLHARYRSLATLSELDAIEEARWQQMVRTCPCRIFLSLINVIEKHPKITFRKNAAVKSINIEDGCVRGVKMQDGEHIAANKVIVATGGLSYPTTGSTGAGYRMATEAGHTVIDQVPSLVALRCEETIPEELVGFALKNVELTICQENGKPIFKQFGEMTFVEDGIDGPIVLSASRIVSRRLHNGERLSAKIDLKPALSNEVLDKRLINDLNSNGTRIFNDALRLWLPAELIPLALKSMHIEYYKRLNQINGAERKRLLTFLKGASFTLIGTHDYNEAIVTQGGIKLKEINPKTMESRLVKGLHFAGEVLDLDADTGGYNLQIAFSTGFAAGNAEM